MKNSGYRVLSGWRVPAAVGLFLIPVIVAGGDSLQLKSGKIMPLKSIPVWRDGAKEYQVESSEGDIKVTVALKDIERLDIAKPADLDKAQQLIEAGNDEAAIPLLESVIDRYKMLVWDVKARGILGRIYLKKKNATKALDTLQPLFTSQLMGAVPAGERRAYWDALLAAGRTDDLRKELNAAIAAGRRDDAAAALVMRGNMLQAAGKHEEALQDYLTTVWFFEGSKDVQPEALFKAAEGLKEVRDARAEECRKVLLQKYPDSEFAKKAAGKAE